MKIKNKLFCALAVLASLNSKANPYIDNVDILNAGISAIDSACLLHAPYGPPLNADTGEFLNFRRCLESNNYTDYRKPIPLKKKFEGKDYYLGEMSAVTLAHYSLMSLPTKRIKQLYIPPLLLVGENASIGVRAVESSTARVFYAEQKALLNKIKEDQQSFEKASSKDSLPISNVSIFGYKEGTEYKESTLIYFVYSTPNSVLIKKITGKGASELSETQFIDETGLLVNPLFER